VVWEGGAARLLPIPIERREIESDMREKTLILLESIAADETADRVNDDQLAWLD
jgi:hypothetical protein